MTAYGFVSKCVPCFGLPFSLLRIGVFLTAKYSVKVEISVKSGNDVAFSIELWYNV